MKSTRAKLLGGKPIIPNVCQGPGVPGLVSVLIPTYNRGYILKAALESVLAQSYRPIEVIVVDDGSTDDTRAIVEQFGSEVRYIYQANGGLAAARNTGLAEARGEFIAFQDSDDVWLPGKLAAQVAIMQSVPEVALAWTNMTSVNSRGDVLPDRHLRTIYSAYQAIDFDKTFYGKGNVKDVWHDCPAELDGAAFYYGDIFSAMFLGNVVHPPTALMRREHVCKAGGLDVTFSWAGEDYEFFWRVSRYGLGAFVDAPGMLYRVGDEDQYTHALGRAAPAHGYLLAIERCFERDRDRLDLPAGVVRRTLAEAYAWVAEEDLRSAEGGRAARYFWKSLSLQLLQKRALILFPFSLVPKPLFRSVLSLKQRMSGTAVVARLLLAHLLLVQDSAFDMLG